MTTAEQEFVADANLSRNIAKTMLRQDHAVKFFGKKVDAVGLAVVSIANLLSEIAKNDHVNDNQVTQIKGYNDQLTSQFESLESNWHDIADIQNAAHEHLNSLTALTHQIEQEHDDHQKNAISHITDLQATTMTELSTIDKRLNSVSTKLDNLDTISVLQNMLQQIADLKSLFVNTTQQQSKQNQIVIQHSTALLAVSQLLIKSIEHYDNQLNVLNIQVKKIDLTIDAIDERLNDITPKNLNMSKNQIFDMFRNVQNVIDGTKADESDANTVKSVEESSTDSDETMESVNTAPVTSDMPKTDDVTAENNQNVNADDEKLISDTKRASRKKKPFWSHIF